MHELTGSEAEAVGGAGFVLGLIRSKLVDWVFQEIAAGNIDYASIAEQQGTYYNMTGA